MKRFTLVILMLLLASTVFAQDLVENIDGFDWVTWTYSQKGAYVQGWMSAYSSIISLLSYQSGGEVDEATREIINNYLYIPLNVGQIVSRIDEVYAAHDNRQYRLLEVFMIITGKDFWNSNDTPKQEDDPGPNI